MITDIIVECIHPNARIPTQANPGDACYDLYTPETVVLAPQTQTVVATGIQIQLPLNWEAQIRGRSGLASQGIMAHPGTIDQRYRKEIGVILYNLNSEPWSFKPGERLAQIAFRPVPETKLIPGVVEETQRGGFGSTGK